VSPARSPLRLAQWNSLVGVKPARARLRRGVHVDVLDGSGYIRMERPSARRSSRKLFVAAAPRAAAADADAKRGNDFVVDARDSPSALLRAAALVIRVAAVDEVVSSATGRALWHATTEPLARAVLGRIMRDEFKHAALGAAFLDWADGSLGAEDRLFLAACARTAIDGYRSFTDAPPSSEPPLHPANPLAWFSSSAYRTVRDTAIRDLVATPLARRSMLVR
jgi:hypothetical protein